MSALAPAPDRLSHYVDLAQYPIHDLTSNRGKALIAECHGMMREDTLCLLPGFLRDAAVEELAEEINALASDAHQIDYPSTPYGWMNNAGFAKDHPRSSLHRRNCGVLTADQFSSNGPCLELFVFDELTEFVRRLLQFETLYRSACPTLSVQVNVMRVGERFGWHFDTNDGVVSFMIQEAEEGGAFEYAPLIRAEDDENYAGVARVFAGVDAPLAPRMPRGTFTLFMGRRSVHRVAPVGGTARPRLSLLYSYDQRPDMVFPEGSCQAISQPSPEPYLGAGARVAGIDAG